MCLLLFSWLCKSVGWGCSTDTSQEFCGREHRFETVMQHKLHLSRAVQALLVLGNWRTDCKSCYSGLKNERIRFPAERGRDDNICNTWSACPAARSWSEDVLAPGSSRKTKWEGRETSRRHKDELMGDKQRAQGRVNAICQLCSFKQRQN